MSINRNRVLPLLVFGALLLVAALSPLALASDNGQWETFDPVISRWFRTLMQPDNPTVSCCGGSDAYYADVFETEGNQYIAVITDTRDDGPLGRHHVAPGTRIRVPNEKLKIDRGNPTGHGVIFLSMGNSVYCYVTPSGT
jgi:hypothetical protein